MAGFQPTYSTNDFNNGSLPSKKLVTGGFLAVKIRNFSSKTMMLTDTVSDGTDQPFPIDTINPWTLKHLILDEAQQFIYIQPVPNGPTQVINDPYFTNQRVDYGTDNVPQVYESDLSAGMRAVAGGVTITSGSVDATVSGSVDIASGTVDATITNATIDVTAGTALPVEFPNAQQVNVESGNVNSTIENIVLGQTNLVQVATITMTIANLAAAASQSAGVYNGNGSAALGFYDMIWFRISSASGKAKNYNIEVDNTAIGEHGLISSYEMTTYTLQNGVWVAASLMQWGPRNNSIGVTGPMLLSPSQLFDDVSISLVNGGSSTIASDTVTVELYAHYATRNIEVTNDTTNPVNNAPVPGEPFNSYEVQLTQGTSVTFTELLPSGGKIQALHISIFQQSAAINSQVVITNGSNGPIIAQLPAYRPASSGSGPAFYSLYFGTGIANNGIYGYLQGGATGNSVMVTTFGVV